MAADRDQTIARALEGDVSQVVPEVEPANPSNAIELETKAVVSIEALIVNSLERASSYVTTNGTISISKFGVYVTIIGVLVSFAYGGNAPKNVVLGPVISAFSILILPVCAALFSWIHEQLTYVEIAGSVRRKFSEPLSYEDFCAECTKRGASIGVFSMLSRHIQFCAQNLLPLTGLYSVYFSTYVIAPHATLAIVLSADWQSGWINPDLFLTSPALKWHGTLLSVQLIALFLSLKDHYRFCAGLEQFLKDNGESRQ